MNPFCIHQYHSNSANRPVYLCFLLLAFTTLTQAGELEYDREPIEYSKSTPTNRVSDLQKRIDEGTAKFQYDEEYGWLKSLLDELKVPQSSQMLVFSKTSLQRHRISPRRPRGALLQRRRLCRLLPKGRRAGADGC